MTLSELSPLPQKLGIFRMARWPRHKWTTLFTYVTMFFFFPLLCYLAFLFVRGR